MNNKLLQKLLEIVEKIVPTDDRMSAIMSDYEIPAGLESIENAPKLAQHLMNQVDMGELSTSEITSLKNILNNYAGTPMEDDSADRVSLGGSVGLEEYETEGGPLYERFLRLKYILDLIKRQTDSATITRMLASLAQNTGASLKTANDFMEQMPKGSDGNKNEYLEKNIPIAGKNVRSMADSLSSDYKIANWRKAHWKRRLAEIGLGLLAIVLTVSLVLALTNPFTLGITTALVLGAVAGAVAGAGIALLARYSRYIMPGIPGVSTIGKWYRSLKENHPKKVFAIKTLLFAGAVTGLVFASIFLPALPILFFEPTKAIAYMGLATFGATLFGINPFMDMMSSIWSKLPGRPAFLKSRARRGSDATTLTSDIDHLLSLGAPLEGMVTDEPKTAHKKHVSKSSSTNKKKVRL